MKVFVFQRENGRHLAIPVAYALVGLLAVAAGAALMIAGHAVQGIIAIVALWLITAMHFRSHRDELIQAAMAEYHRKYVDIHDEYEGEYDEDEEDEEDFELEAEMLADGEVTEATELAPEVSLYQDDDVPVLTDVVEPSVIAPTPSFEDGYEDGYKDGRDRLEAVFEWDEETMSDYDFGYREGYRTGRGHKARRYFD